ncbi:flavin reductase family protein [Crenothrix polyspora]|uniref:FMN reductase (NADH) RutF n=1 Tax=Crenothrix polyspora TaxID=360316 RepID=A0A1R4HJK1_9GAMM|nr:flavin reductase family protein [Crenothrix polyspora]SJM96396.1 FMN reductase (NADH) RutF [Crenothrix polyspora]
MATSADDFKQALQLWASGVAIVTTQSEQYGVRGMTVTAFSSVSAQPPQILVCINQSADTGENINASGLFAVNILNANQQDDSNNFSGGNNQEQRFANAHWEMGQFGTPLLTDSIMSLECKVVEKVAAGTHWVIIAEVQAAISRTGEPLLYYRGAYRQLNDA